MVWLRAIWFGFDGVGVREEGDVVPCSEDREWGNNRRVCAGRLGDTGVRLGEKLWVLWGELVWR